MNESVEDVSNIKYPTLELGGEVYTLKFTRGGLIYRLSKSGANISDLQKPLKSFAALIDILHAALFGQYTGTVHELAELVNSEGVEKTREANIAVLTALGKVFPSTTAAAAAGIQEPDPKPAVM